MTEDSSHIRVVFFGTPDFAAVSLKALIDTPEIQVTAVVSQPDRRSGRGKRLTPPPVKTAACAAQIEVLQPGNLKREKDTFLNQISDFGPFDIGVVAAFGQILPREVLDLPAAGCVNVHASLLPRWRGAAPIQRAILAGDQTTGVCLMQMEEGLDTGGVYVHEEIPIADDESCGSVHDRLADCGAALLKQHLSAIVTGTLTATPQPQEGITYANKISRDESCIDWSLKCLEVHRTIRAFAPAPGAFTYLNDRRLKILGAAVINDSNQKGAASPGEVVAIGKDTLEIQCGSGYLSITALQPEGKRKMTAADFIRGSDLNTGDRFSSQRISPSDSL